MPGYNKPLYILAFDHRSFFAKNLFKKTGELSDDERAVIKDFKQIIYQGFLRGLELGVPEDGAAVLVDEEFGLEIHEDAEKRGLINILTTEKSGQEVFDFQYGDEFGAHLEAVKPVFAKALVRYRPDGDADANRVQLERLKTLSDWCHANARGFLIEPLVLPSEDEKQSIGQDAFDRDIRPALTVEMIRQFQEAGVEPDIWKIEGMDRAESYRAVVEQARADGRNEVSCVVLGRAEDGAKVDAWLRAAIGVEGMVGFAIGRTIFWDALQYYYQGKAKREEAIEAIAQNYMHFYEVFTGRV
ncbi:DUF2090 domain-containing protein [Patescibacteria group bacterium]|jgi:myo-inositol catabolism protein IolC|nr:DUF2090 domain-containing protein [Patescibacteria group bacterium]